MQLMKLYENKDWLYKRYITQKKSLDEMAAEAGCSKMTIIRHLEKNGIGKMR
jgi:DNA-binding MurR/RpiR family transcriptional regulator